MDPDKLPHRVKIKKISIFLLGLMLCVIFLVVLCFQTQNKATVVSKSLSQIKLLILYSSGNTTSQWETAVPNISEDIDAISSPTSKFVNKEVIANMIAHYLKKEMSRVTLKRFEEIKKSQEVLVADVILIGSATRFGIMSWQTKRFFDQTLFPICVHRRKRLSDKYIGCFTTCEVYPSGKDCIKSINRALYDFETNKLPSLIILDKTPQDELEKKVAHFTNELIAKLQHAYAP